MDYLLPMGKGVHLKWRQARAHTGHHGWSQSVKLHRKFGPGARTPPAFIGPKYLTPQNWENMSKWNKVHFTFETAAKKAQFIRYFISELKKSNWDPKQITWLIAGTIPVLGGEIKALYYSLCALRAGRTFTLLEAFLYITTGLITILDKYTFGAVSPILKKVSVELGFFLLKKGSQLTWYTFKKMLRLIVKLCSLLYKLPSSLFRKVVGFPTKIHSVEPSASKAYTISRSATPPKSAKLTPAQMAKYKSMVAKTASALRSA